MKATTVFAGGAGILYSIVGCIQGIWDVPSRTGTFFIALSTVTLVALIIRGGHYLYEIKHHK